MQSSKAVQQTKGVNRLYEQNQKLGYRINYLNDQNNFYRISINNIKKLNCNIEKKLNPSNTRPVTDDSQGQHRTNITQPYTLINHKIQLKNLQMKVGNSKRKTDKMRRVFQGSVPSLLKKAQLLESQINVLAREYEYFIIENQLLSNIYMADFYQSIYKPLEPPPKHDFFVTHQERYTNHDRISLLSRQKSSNNISGNRMIRTANSSIHLCRGGDQLKGNPDAIAALEAQEIQFANRLQVLKKEEKHIRKERLELLQQIKSLTETKNCLRDHLASGKEGRNLREVQANESNRLAKLGKQEEKIVAQINRQDELLEEQYRINQEFRQKIIDRNEQESKEIKVLQEEIQKCSEQVREIKLKCEQIQNLKGVRSRKK